MKISTTAQWHNKKILAWLPKFGTTQSSVWVEWGAWLLEIVVRRRTQRVLDVATACPKCGYQVSALICTKCGTPIPPRK